jgi:E3 ubiquitin-protein ligase RNF14
MCCDSCSDFIHLPQCGHRSCKGMLEGWIAAQVEGLCGVHEIKAACCSVLLTPEQVHLYGRGDVTARAERHSLEKALVTMGDWKWCSMCSSGGFIASGEMNAKRCRSAACADCNFSFCLECGVDENLHTRVVLPHQLKCADEEVYIEVKENDQEELSGGRIWLSCKEASEFVQNKIWLDANSKSCPKSFGGCGALTQRDGGCSHMTCKVCKFQWCWVCGGKYSGVYTMGSKCPC